jgi:hypothetical protein
MSALTEAARAELISALEGARQTFGKPGTRDVDVVRWNERIDRALAALAADEARAPVARVEETAVGPKLYVHGVFVHCWLGCVHDADVRSIAGRINDAAHPPAPAAQAEQPAQSMCPHQHAVDDWRLHGGPGEQPAQGLADEVLRGCEPVETVLYWRDVYANPASGPHFMGHGMVVKLLTDYLQLRAALASAPRVPRSHKIVPRYPTDTMLQAASQGTTHTELRRVWDAMLAAAPQPEGGQS